MFLFVGISKLINVLMGLLFNDCYLILVVLWLNKIVVVLILFDFVCGIVILLLNLVVDFCLCFW